MSLYVNEVNEFSLFPITELRILSCKPPPVVKRLWYLTDGRGLFGVSESLLWESNAGLLGEGANLDWPDWPDWPDRQFVCEEEEELKLRSFPAEAEADPRDEFAFWKTYISFLRFSTILRRLSGAVVILLRESIIHETSLWISDGPFSKIDA